MYKECLYFSVLPMDSVLFELKKNELKIIKKKRSGKQTFEIYTTIEAYKVRDSINMLTN